MNTYTVVYYLPEDSVKLLCGMEATIRHHTCKAKTAYEAEQVCKEEYPTCVVFCVNEGITAANL